MRSHCPIALLLLAAAGCGPAALEKGGLVRVSTPRAALDAAHAPRRFAVVVGISAVADAGWRPLRYAEKDAKDVAAALGDPARGRFDHVQVLTAPQETTGPAILAALDALAGRASRPDDVALLYLSAHGTLARDDRGELRRYLVTHEAQLSSPAATALPVDALKQRLDRLPSRRRVMILATCHSGSGKSLLPPEVAEELSGIKSGFFAAPLEAASRASIVLSASDFGETAREDSALQNDIYTHFLIEGLGGTADRNLDGAVVATEAHDYARRRTYAFTGGRQRPSAEILESGADPVVLAGDFARGGDAEIFSYAPRLEGARLRVDGEEKAELPGGAAVPPGRRHLQVVKGSSVLISAEVDLPPGARVAVDALGQERPPQGAVALSVGAVGFLDGPSREAILPATLSGGLQVRLDGLPTPDLSLLIDAAGSLGRAEIRVDGAAVPLAYREVLAGVAVTRGWTFGRFSAFTGPRLAALWLGRSFDLVTYRASQDYLTVAPGWVGMAAVRLGGRLELSLLLSAMATYVRVDGQGSVKGHAGASAAAGWAF